MAQRVHPEGSPDRVRRPNRGAKQDEPGDRPGSRVDGAPAQTDGLVRPHLVGTTIYKMTGSGNDFVMVDSRHTSPADWSVEDIRAVCARGTGVGADGLVFVGPGSAPDGSDVVRMIYFNSDGSRAAMCGNAALCSTRLAARLAHADLRARRRGRNSGVRHGGRGSRLRACRLGTGQAPGHVLDQERQAARDPGAKDPGGAVRRRVARWGGETRGAGCD